MCGIAGSINFKLDSKKIHAALVHRGPDEQLSLTIDNVELIHNRLSIIDSEGGKQPMRRGHLTICYNGEIYNHEALRKQHNLTCKSHSDTETLLALYEKYGTSCLKYLDGMFAFAVYDSRHNSLFLARDRAGEKPLYIWQKENMFVFCSELNTLRTIVPSCVDDQSINAFLSCGVMFGQGTPYTHITEVEPGSAITIDTTTLESENFQWFSIHNAFNDQSTQLNNFTFEESLAWVDESLTTSITRQLLASDLEVGAFLSGGIDSGLVCAIAAQNSAKLKTFTVSFDDQFDESGLALQTATRYSTDHNVLRIDYSDLAHNIEQIIGNYGEPIADDSIVPTWYVSKAAKEHVTVVLTGDGADELFGGYRRYVPYTKLNLFNDAGEYSRVARAMLSALPSPTRKQSRYNYLHRLCELLAKDGINRYLASTTMIDGHELNHADITPHMQKYFQAVSGSTNLSSLDKMMAMDSKTLLSGALLPKMDIGSMAHSLETRTPFLSKALLENIPALPDNYKIRGKQTKYLLRQLAQRYLPEEVSVAPKRGFETPLVKWVGKELQQPIMDLLTPGNAYVRRFYKQQEYERLLHEKKTPSIYRARLLWMMYCTEVWHMKQQVQST